MSASWRRQEAATGLNPQRVPRVQEVEDEAGTCRSAAQAIVEEPDDNGGYQAPRPAASQRCQPERCSRGGFGRSLFDDPFFDEPMFPSRLFGDCNSLFPRHEILGPEDLLAPHAGFQSRDGAFSYSCSTWSSVGSFGGPTLQHMCSASGSSDGGHRLKEVVRNGRTGQTRVLREESWPSSQRQQNSRRIDIN